MARKENYLYREFAQFYARERCRWAPTNPRRVFGMAFKGLYPTYRVRVTPQLLLGLVYEVLGVKEGGPRGLFQAFDPEKYTKALPPEEHFVNFFRWRLKGAVRNFLIRTPTDQNRPGDRARFKPRPELGLHAAALTYRSDRDLEEALEGLGSQEERVIRLVYWGGHSRRAVGRLLGLDHKTVASRHDAALRKLQAA